MKKVIPKYLSMMMTEKKRNSISHKGNFCRPGKLSVDMRHQSSTDELLNSKTKSPDGPQYSCHGASRY